MKAINILGLFALVLVLALSACKKENDFGGAAKIEGKVTLNGAAVPNAFVYLAFNATDKTSERNASSLTDSDGHYVFGGLLRGNYYVTAEYTNSAGMKFTSGGSKVTIGDKKGTVTADLTLE
jgi:hypothetical protein